MHLLMDAPKGLYGLQIVERSEGAVKRGSVYVLLGRLEDKGFVEQLPTKAAPGYPGLPRPIYKLTADGRRVLLAAQEIGLRGVFA